MAARGCIFTSVSSDWDWGTHGVGLDFLLLLLHILAGFFGQSSCSRVQVGSVLTLLAFWEEILVLDLVHLVHIPAVFSSRFATLP